MHRLVISSRGNVITGSEVEDILSENTFGDMVINIKKQLDGSDKVDSSADGSSGKTDYRIRA